MKVGDLVRFKPNRLYPTKKDWSDVEWTIGLLVEKELNHCTVMTADSQLHRILSQYCQKAGKRDFQKGAKNEQQD